MKLDIPEHCYIRWQAALAVAEDLEAHEDAPFNMDMWADEDTKWERDNGYGTVACFAGYISVSPYCHDLGYPESDWNNGFDAGYWLLESVTEMRKLYWEVFSDNLQKETRAKTLAYLKRTLKSIFKESTGKTLTALTEYEVEV